MIEVRIAIPSDAWAIRTLRMEALENDSRYFTASYSEEKLLPRTAWRSACSETTDNAMFAAFDNHVAVGMLRATKLAPGIIKWGSAYIQPIHRCSDIGALLYALREDWSVAQGYEKAMFTIRNDNEKSAALHIKHGAIAIREEPMRWANEEFAPAVWYEKKLVG